MYAPPKSQEHRPEVLKAAIADIRFASLVSPQSDGIAVTHVPMIVREAADGLRLDCHVARGNPHWQQIADGCPSVAIFQGPQAYMSPRWYPSKQEHGKVVPTWLYIAVHAHGVLEPMTSDQELAQHLSALTDHNEAGRDAPWSVSDAPDGFIGSLSRGIKGLSLKVDTLVGSWKLNQHKPAADIGGSLKGLAAESPDGQRLAAALKDALD